MPQSSNGHPDDRDASQSSVAPDWAKVPFDVGCARCGHDLRGLTDPTCPACGLTFEWAEAVPVEQLTCVECGYHLFGLPETRCPECGTSFTWEGALAEHHRRRLPLIEYCWRQRPIRSLVATFRLAMRPRKLWRLVKLHDPPQLRALLVSSVFVLTVGMMLFTSITTLFRWAKYVRWGVRRSGFFGYLAEVPERLWYAVSAPDDWYYHGLPVLLWACSVFAALMIFRESMRRCRVRTVHVLRVWAYSILFLAPVFGIAWSLWFGVALCLNFDTYPLSVADDSAPYRVGLMLVDLALIGYVAYAIRVGYRDYLRLDRSAAVALAAVGVGTLLALVLGNLLISPDFSAWRLITLFGPNR